MGHRDPLRWTAGPPASERQAVVIGHKADVIVTVSCIPQGPTRTWVVEVATSPDGKAAEAERNAIRTEIQRLRRID